MQKKSSEARYSFVLLSPFSPLPFLASFLPPLLLEVGPLNTARGLGSAVSSPSVVRIGVKVFLLG